MSDYSHINILLKLITAIISMIGLIILIYNQMKLNLYLSIEIKNPIIKDDKNIIMAILRNKRRNKFTFSNKDCFIKFYDYNLKKFRKIIFSFMDRRMKTVVENLCYAESAHLKIILPLNLIKIKKIQFKDKITNKKMTVSWIKLLKTNLEIKRLFR